MKVIESRPLDLNISHVQVHRLTLSIHNCEGSDYTTDELVSDGPGFPDKHPRVLITYPTTTGRQRPYDSLRELSIVDCPGCLGSHWVR